MSLNDLLNMRAGVVVVTTSFRHVTRDVTLSYSAPKGEVFNLVHLGTCLRKDAPTFDAEAALNKLGWIAAELKPEVIERVAKAMHEKSVENLKIALGVDSDEHLSWADTPEHQKVMTRAIAKAALEAI